ncbi:hypothetical protein STXM2123_1039 [Streptomyces sp. F-3]|nr:hypothetical protein STXM2123_1039 [Streptomyces sp. F-3]
MVRDRGHAGSCFLRHLMPRVGSIRSFHGPTRPGPVAGLGCPAGRW